MDNAHEFKGKRMILLPENGGDLFAHVVDDDGEMKCTCSSGCSHGFNPHPQRATAEKKSLIV